MGIPKPTVRAVMSLALALAVASVFTLSSFAASTTKEGPPGGNAGGRIRKTLLDAPTGRLLGTGRITIDGDEARSGATVLSGSTIATGMDGYARIDLGSLGRFELRPNTTITLMFGADGVQVRMNGAGLTAHSLSADALCQVKLLDESTRLVVSSGQVKVDSAGDTRTLNSGQEARFSKGSEARTMGEAVFTAESSDRDRNGSVPTSGGPHTISAGPVGAMVLAGLAGGVALGVMLGSNDPARPSTLPKPSTVVP
jgi:hypothetical protein